MRAKSKKPIRWSPAEYIALTKQHGGICTACSARTPTGVEPNARDHPCASCGQPTVCGVETLLKMNASEREAAREAIAALPDKTQMQREIKQKLLASFDRGEIPDPQTMRRKLGGFKSAVGQKEAMRLWGSFDFKYKIRSWIGEAERWVPELSEHLGVVHQIDEGLDPLSLADEIEYRDLPHNRPEALVQKWRESIPPLIKVLQEHLQPAPRVYKAPPKPIRMSVNQHAELRAKSGGVCLGCFKPHTVGLTPNARGVTCTSCGAHEVYAIREIERMGRLRITKEATA
jgi:hypothetical protein